MKIAPSYISREKLVEKAAKRARRTIEDHTKISTAFQPEKSKIIEENIDSVARYAKRHNIEIEFEPHRGAPGSVKMSVYERNIKYVEPFDNSMDPFPYLSTDFAGVAFLPENMTDKKEFMDTVRKESAKILYGDK